MNYKRVFPNPTAMNLGEALGIPMNRQNELSKHLDDMVKKYGVAPTLVYVADIVGYMESVCKTPEEFLYCYTNHLTWHAKRGSLMAAKTNRTMKEMMDELNDDQRVELFRNYCHSCGCTDPGCQCWNYA